MVHNIICLSQVSNEDFVNIVGQYNHVIQGGREEVDPKLSSRGYSKEVLELAKKNVVVQPISSCGLRFKKHLSNFKYPLFGYVLTLFSNYEKGVLPFEGSVSEQPGQIMDMFSVLETLKSEQETKLQQKLERDGRRKRENSARTR